MPELQVIDYSISPKIALDEEWSRGDVTTKRVIELLIENNHEFNEVMDGSEIIQFTGTLISDGRAFMSKVFKIYVEFSNQKDYSFVLKVSQHMQWNKYAENGGCGSPERDENHNECDLREKQKEMMEIGASYHNIETLFYLNFPPIPNCPTPKTFYVEPIDEAHNGLILMENLADSSAPLGFYPKSPTTAEQLFSVAKCAANLHFQADRDDLRLLWSKLTGHVYLDLFIDEFQITGFPLLKPYPEIIELLDDVKPVFDREFCYYSMVDLPKKYNAFMCCHGDFQPNNILFELDKKSNKLTDKVTSIIDWQLIFGGNPFTDLVRFLVGAVDDDLRVKVDTPAFDVYYNELKRLYEENGRKVGFTREQAFELYELSIIEQTGSYIILLPFVEQRKSALNLDEKTSGLFSKRIADATRRLPPLIQKYKLNEKFGQNVDWRSLMYQTI